MSKFFLIVDFFELVVKVFRLAVLQLFARVDPAILQQASEFFAHAFEPHQVSPVDPFCQLR